MSFALAYPPLTFLFNIAAVELTSLKELDLRAAKKQVRLYEYGLQIGVGFIAPAISPEINNYYTPALTDLFWAVFLIVPHIAELCRCAKFRRMLLTP